VDTCDIPIFLRHLPDFLPFGWVRALHAWWFFGKNVLDAKNFVEKLELLLCYFLVVVVY
jgi:hypothetical protein